jgi:hypothetical protein
MCLGPLWHECPCLDLTHAELASAGKFDCQHLSSNFKGPCIVPFSESACKSVCLAESSDNTDGFCGGPLQCWCKISCTPEAVAAASAPIRH